MKFIQRLMTGLFPRSARKGSAKSSAETMRAMRHEWLTHIPDQGEFELEDDVVAVLMEWPQGKDTATVLASAGGDTSLYTTSSFGIIGGVGHESVRQAARHFTTRAQYFLHLASPTSEFPYPEGQTLQLYFITPTGVRTTSFPMDEVEVEKTPARALFSYGQEVLTQLRLSSPDLS